MQRPDVEAIRDGEEYAGWRTDLCAWIAELESQRAELIWGLRGELERAQARVRELEHHVKDVEQVSWTRREQWTAAEREIDSLKAQLESVTRERDMWKNVMSDSTDRELERENAALRTALGDFRLWLIHKREECVVSVPVTDARGHVVNTFAAVRIPEWDVRQKIDNIEFALSVVKESLPTQSNQGDRTVEEHSQVGEPQPAPQPLDLRARILALQPDLNLSVNHGDYEHGYSQGVADAAAMLGEAPAQEVSFADCKNPDCPIGCPDSHALGFTDGLAPQPCPECGGRDGFHVQRNCKGTGSQPQEKKMSTRKLIQRGIAAVAGDRMTCSIADHERACCVLIDIEQRKIAPDTRLINTLCESVRLCREHVAMWKDKLVIENPMLTCGHRASEDCICAEMEPDAFAEAEKKMNRFCVGLFRDESAREVDSVRQGKVV